MEDFFDTIYYYTSGLYGQNLDNYLYSTVPGYVHVGLVMVVSSFVLSVLFYYAIKPVRNQMATWLGCLSLNAFINLAVALWYTNTPLINNEVDMSKSWGFLDTLGFGVADAIWSALFFSVIPLLIKWWSPNKYIPFKKF